MKYYLHIDINILYIIIDYRYICTKVERWQMCSNFVFYYYYYYYTLHWYYYFNRRRPYVEEAAALSFPSRRQTVFASSSYAGGIEDNRQ